MTDVIEVGALTIRYLVDGAAKGGMGVFELTVPPGAMVPPPHSHTDKRGVCVRAGRHAPLLGGWGDARPEVGRLDVDAAGLRAPLRQPDSDTGARAGRADAGYRRGLLPRVGAVVNAGGRPIGEAARRDVEVRARASRAARMSEATVPTSKEALRRHRAATANGPESLSVWLFHAHVYFDHSVAERVAESPAVHGADPRDVSDGNVEVHSFIRSRSAHTRAEASRCCSRARRFAEYVTWMMFARPPSLDILIHPFDAIAGAGPHAAGVLARDATPSRDRAPWRKPTRRLERRAQRGVDHRATKCH